MFDEQRPHGPSRSSTTPIIKGFFRTALDVLTEPSSPSPHRSSSHRRRQRSPSPPRRAYTQSVDNRHHSHSRDRSYTEHDPGAAQGHSRGAGDGLEDLLRKAAHELSDLVGDFEAKLKRRGGVPAGPSGIMSDDDRFEELSDEELPEGYSSRSAPANAHGASTPVGGYPHQHQARQSGSRGHADEYYYGGASGGVAPPHGPYVHPQPVAPSYPDHYNQSYPPHSTSLDHHHSARPKPKRSSTSATMRKVGGELLQNLPALLQRAGWLLSLLETQQMRSGGKKSKRYSGLLMALTMVSELYRQFQSEGGSRRRSGRR